LALQEETFEARIENPSLQDVIILCQHLPVITLGRRTQSRHLKMDAEFYTQLGFEILTTDRGGSVTSHEPGQWVLYPILNLKRRGWTVRIYLDWLVQVTVDLCRVFGVDAAKCPSPPIPQPEGTHVTGVWVGQQKLASVGIRVQNGITLHGLALNVNNDCKIFEWLDPCGFSNLRVTSMAQILGRSLSMDSVAKTWRQLMGASPAHFG
jgi:lipoate-protein ligase B